MPETAAQAQDPTPGGTKQALPVAMPAYQGDVSYWGKQAMSEEYFEDRSVASSQNQPSLSSGLSPRDAHPRARDWDEEEGYRVCTRLVIRQHDKVVLPNFAPSTDMAHSPAFKQACKLTL